MRKVRKQKDRGPKADKKESRLIMEGLLGPGLQVYQASGKVRSVLIIVRPGQAGEVQSPLYRAFAGDEKFSCRLLAAVDHVVQVDPGYNGAQAAAEVAISLLKPMKRRKR